jgi:ADP-heptose:LPS heptosyltransferase
MPPRGTNPRTVRRVLVIFPGALGDLMCLMPSLAAIARRHPGASIELMARMELAQLAAGRTVVTRAHSIDAREVGALFTDDTSGIARRLFGDFDRIYSFFATDDSRFRARLSAATDAHVSFHPFRPAGDGHISTAYLRSIETEVDDVASTTNPRLEPTPNDLAAATSALAQSKCGTSNLLVMFPGSGSPGKNWSANKFVALASELSELASVAVVLGPAEMSLEPVFGAAGVSVLKQLDLPMVAAIARVASAFVGNDSGVSHLAAAVGASGVVIFGPTDPARWRPVAPEGGGQIAVVRRTPIETVDVREIASILSKFVA